MYNHINRSLKKEVHRERIRQWLSDYQEIQTNITIDTLDARETEQLIALAVDQLPPQKRKIYRMSQQQGKSHAEIAAELQLSPLTVKDHLKEAMRLIRIYLKNTALLIAVLSDYFHR